MVKFPEANARLYKNIFICKGCKSDVYQDQVSEITKRIGLNRTGQLLTIVLIFSTRFLVPGQVTGIDKSLKHVHTHISVESAKQLQDKMIDKGVNIYICRVSNSRICEVFVINGC